jgi:hypothetical protein
MKANNQEMLARLEAKIESNQVKTDVKLEDMKVFGPGVEPVRTVKK